MNRIKLRNQLGEFFNEDIGDGDLTSMALPQNQIKTAEIIAKEKGIFVGKEIITEGYSLLNPELKTEIDFEDGEIFEKGQKIATVVGPVDQILLGERVILNVIQRLSGIATMTYQVIKNLQDSSIRICDTRKTTPGLRMLEKYAVKCGGGYNHRTSLNHSILLKENHIEAYGGIKEAISAVKSKTGHIAKIEVEITNQKQLIEAIEEKPDVIMFDNYSPNDIQEQIQLVPSEIVTEASGGINYKNIVEFRGCGVDYISLGFLTHSITSIDFSMLVKGE
ncbi:carboxylating nicotinate-nucleotide diphosphorylase [Alkalihalobacillus trypoxylicola]|uniref:Probable nicotinate-nucleotide pyrophosphorylase [carboxylating] n=1 Tax=Alkalihalobacillus trypoxylicola TaxID=519424 RepID=A0A161PFF7_9BACI|nr:carboxylating nicotinate-nucleotide diphosphorylase [Alkalihalobacillus trypoxylicola]KYG31857.1 nicotinate-nucleotide pyrophosphorylase [Alkalihalobacillus trypoxylicola]